MLNKLFRSDFAKHAAWITGGTAISQAITILASVFVTRLYTDEDFGVFTLYVAILSVLVILGSLKLEHAIPITNNQGATLNLIGLNFTILVIFSSLVFLAVLLFGGPISRFFKEPRLQSYLLLLPFGLFLAGAYNILYQWALKEKHFKIINRTKISQGAGLSIGKIGIGLFHASPFGLIVGHIISKCAGVFSLYRDFASSFRGTAHQLSKRRMYWALKRFRKFPLLTLPSQLLSALGQRIPVFLITTYFGLDIVGQYGLSEMIVSLPILLIGTAVGDVFYAEVAEKGRKHPEKILVLSNDLIKKLALIGIFPMLVLLFLGPTLFAFVFGENWRLSGEIAQVLGVLSFVRLVFTPISRVYMLYEKHTSLLVMNSLRIAVIFLCFGAAKALGFDHMQTIILYTIGMSFVYLTIFLYARRIIKQQIISLNIHNKIS